jgi:hypothetical protein
VAPGLPAESLASAALAPEPLLGDIAAGEVSEDPAERPITRIAINLLESPIEDLALSAAWGSRGPAARERVC